MGRHRRVVVDWDAEASHFTAVGTHPGRVIVLNAPRPPDQPAEATGFSPTELLLAGAGSCAGWDVVEILRKRRAQIASLEVTVDGFQHDEPPWAYERVALHFRIAGDGLAVPVMARIIRLSIVRYCSVITTIAGVAAIEATVEVVAPDGTSTGRQPIELAIPAIPPPAFVEPVADED